MFTEGKTVEPLVADSESIPSNEQVAPPQSSLLELNSVLLIVMAGMAALSIAGLFVLSHA